MSGRENANCTTGRHFSFSVCTAFAVNPCQAAERVGYGTASGTIRLFAKREPLHRGLLGGIELTRSEIDHGQITEDWGYVWPRTGRELAPHLESAAKGALRFCEPA